MFARRISSRRASWGDAYTPPAGIVLAKSVGVAMPDPCQPHGGDYAVIAVIMGVFALVTWLGLTKRRRAAAAEQRTVAAIAAYFRRRHVDAEDPMMRTAGEFIARCIESGVWKEGAR
jgi:hypothetical protein